ncbi:SDR family oxidoreductase [Actinoplanes sichuanensis]|uniref:SDR family oxidoreductase n=1 Tax=Actinoplanes sichuanensis TaxID=512349 RepID=A0ABW4A675_9ACTN|nr:SDR family oxidoreductase [Actinoplanes sichuanensis]BEL05115.1 SDR family oxidoreductase [Actinoplanes sichuanensis]
MKSKPLTGKVALVAGATRGAGRQIAVQLGAAGATVYATGRSTRAARSEYGRPETIEDTADLITEAGGTGIAVAVDHLDHEQVAALIQQIDDEQGRLDVLVNDIFGGDPLTTWNKPVWDQPLEPGLRLLRLAIDTHIITSHYALPLLIRNPGGLVVEVGDGTTGYNATNYRLSVFYDLAKTTVNRLGFIWAHELTDHDATSVNVTPGWIRSEMMLDNFGVTEDNWRDACVKEPHFASSESPVMIGRGIAAMAADPDRARWHSRSVTSFDLAEAYDVTDTDGSRPDAWRYVVEVQDAGKPADVTGYR